MELRMSPVVRAVQQAQDSVVCIDLLNAQAVASRAVETVRPDGQGSGVILDADGLVITNWHVVAAVAQGQAYRIQVRLHDGRHFMARLLSSSPEHDLALLQMEMPIGEVVQPARIGDSKSLMVGETLIAIGNPQGHAHTVTSGVLSAIDRSITVRAPDRRNRKYSGLLQTDAAINGGNSGGALLDITGRLVGINNAMALGSENIGFAIPVDTVREVFEEVLLSSSNLTGPLAGIVIGFRAEPSAEGLVVRDVDADGPAAQSGLRPGDVLQRLATRDVRSPIDLARSLVGARAGQPLALKVRRQGAVRDLTLVPMARGDWQVRQLVGLELETVLSEPIRTRAARALYGNRANRPYNSVLRVAGVKAGSPAADAGLQEGDLLLGVKALRSDWFRRVWVDLATESTSELHNQLLASAGQDVPIIVLRGENMLEGPLFVPRVRR